jgi:hypothetical protein
MMRAAALFFIGFVMVSIASNLADISRSIDHLASAVSRLPH